MEALFLNINLNPRKTYRLSRSANQSATFLSVITVETLREIMEYFIYF